MPDREYVICARGGTPLRSKALEFSDGNWLCFPHVDELIAMLERLGEPYRYIYEGHRNRLAEAGWKGKEWRE